MGARLTGWVTACRQTVTDSDAVLDLFDLDVALKSALSTALVDGDKVVGVLTADAAAPQTFTEDTAVSSR
jgi:putative methionine-R-sulfoxide reductase with GAF domain